MAELSPEAKRLKKEYFKKYREKNREKLNAYRREYYRANSRRVNTYNDNYWENKAKEEAPLSGSEAEQLSMHNLPM